MIRVLLCFLFMLPLASFADCTLQIKTDGVIGPGTFDYIERALERAQKSNCHSILYLIDTPGGSLQSTRLIVEKIINSPVPFLCLVYPGGGHAGSAGAIILQACHVNGAVEATNIGAATPVTMGGEMTEDMRKKILNDTVSWLDGLVDLRGRNKQFARDIVEKALAVDAKEALKRGAIDTVATDIQSFLKFSEGRSVRGPNNAVFKVETAAVQVFDPDVRFRFLDLVTHPQIAYLIFMASLGLLYFEVTHPGMIAPGVAGALGIVISLISFHMLDVHWGALALVFLGIAFMIAELFVTSFGALGIGGIAAFVAGSLLLFDPTVGSVPLSIILPSAVGMALIMLGIGYLGLRAQRTHIKNNNLVGKHAEVVRINDDGRSGKLEIQGEIWNFESPIVVRLKQNVKVTNMIGLKLIVNAESKEA
jgi:membrane-bound serine protease (ClpP class)